jgi:putative transposase
MPWQSTDPMRERLKFITAHESRCYSMSELCRRFGISRETGYTWLARYRDAGPLGLLDRSHAPVRCPHRVSEETQGLIIEARKSHPHWGPRKLLAWLAARHPEQRLPALSTAGELLKRAGLVQSRRVRRGATYPGRMPAYAGAPNDLWVADFKGQFRMGDRMECYPLTITDSFSRFLLCCHGLSSVRTVGTMAAFERTFREYGLPNAIRTDNGVPFAKATPLGLTRLNAWWIKLGIQHDRIEPGRPEQNGAHERMHRTLKAETTRPPGESWVQQQAIFDAFRLEYDFERPHEALGLKSPASVYQPSQREMPYRLPEPEYANHFEVRRVQSTGIIKFRGRVRFISEVLEGETVGLEESDDGIWSVYFYARLLGRLDESQTHLSG